MFSIFESAGVIKEETKPTHLRQEYHCLHDLFWFSLNSHAQKRGRNPFCLNCLSQDQTLGPGTEGSRPEIVKQLTVYRLSFIFLLSFREQNTIFMLRTTSAIKRKLKAPSGKTCFRRVSERDQKIMSVMCLEIASSCCRWKSNSSYPPSSSVCSMLDVLTTFSYPSIDKETDISSESKPSG